MENFGRLVNAILWSALVLGLAGTGLFLLAVVNLADLGERPVFAPRVYRRLVALIALVILGACLAIGATLY